MDAEHAIDSGKVEDIREWKPDWKIMRIDGKVGWAVDVLELAVTSGESLEGQVERSYFLM